MVWLYVVTGLIIIIIMLILLNLEKRKVKGKDDGRHVVVNDSLIICLSCGSRFRGHKCPYCGFDNTSKNE